MINPKGEGGFYICRHTHTVAFRLDSPSIRPCVAGADPDKSSTKELYTTFFTYLPGIVAKSSGFVSIIPVLREFFFPYGSPLYSVFLSRYDNCGNRNSGICVFLK